MAFNQLIFVCLFLPLSVLLYRVIPQKLKKAFLILTSVVFIAWGNITDLLYLICVIVFNYFSVRQIARLKNDGLTKYARMVFISALAVNILFLGYFKYYNFFRSLVGLPEASFGIAVPIGISFYTFQATGYLIDVYRDTVPAEKNLFRFALFVSFFPQIVQGPISSFDQIGNQLYEQHRPEWVRFKEGGELILWGLFKKLVIADRMFAAINTVTTDYTSYAGQIILLSALMYALQLYADFSGGIDIARGVAQIFGIDLALNFRQPYFSKSINEYWRRWHITLGAWMKKYVFYSLAVSDLFLNVSKGIGKTRFGRTSAGKHIARTLPTAMASLIVFMLIGIWHGANSRYIGFGLWNGLVIMFSTLMMPVYAWALGKLRINAKSWAWQLFQMLRTFVIILVGYYFDIAPDMKGALDMMRRSIIDCHLHIKLSQLEAIGLGKSDCGVILCGMLIILYFSIRLEKTGLTAPGELLSRRPAWLQWIVIFAGVLAVIIFGMYGSGAEGTDFVYMGF